ncbi:putative sulfate exporter family transporter [Botrimarina sp.]|uniref:YeiH family protein n=1 Tax=Botrimarina sp. TaxID=2795802 RepID=UPI0032EB09D8
MPRLSEDWLAVLLGVVLLAVCLGAAVASGDAGNPLTPLLATPGGWSESPVEALASGRWAGTLGAGTATLATFAAAAWLGGQKVGRFAAGFVGVFLLAAVSIALSEQATLDYWGLAYALWAIVIGLAIANTVGTPAWLRPAVRTELYMKVGLVLLGAEVLLGKLLALGLPGIGVAWVVTPIVLCTTFWFGQRVLRIESPSLNMVISADMSVCGVSAAIATAAACRAKKEELSLAIGLSIAFTVVMMLAMPPASRAMGLSPEVRGAWIGGTIDSTGAVGAAGSLLGDASLEVAVTIKMIQNVLIGVVAFAVATYWVMRNPESGVRDAESLPGEAPSEDSELRTPTSAFAEIWRRFPKFILGFLGASVVFSAITWLHADGDAVVDATIGGATKTLRTWCFALAFVSIGLETDFRTLAATLRSGKPLVLYVCGQTLNLCLTLAMAWLMFGVVFPDAARVGLRASGVGPQGVTSASAPPKPEARGLKPAAQRLAEAGVDPGALFYTDHPRASAGWGRDD